MTDEYFSWLALDATNDEFIDEVSSVIERDQNDWIITQVDMQLRDYADMLKDLIDEDFPEEKVELIGKISGISVKLGLLRALGESYEKNNEQGEELEKNPGEVKVVYAKNSYGNIMCNKDFLDIKKYGDDKYDSLLKLLGRLYDGDTDFNSEKQKPLTSSNKLKGIYELKDFQIRLIYMRESTYTVVIGALVKKDDNDKKYRSSLESMKKKSEKYRQSIRNNIMDIEEELKAAEEFRVSITEGFIRGK